MRSKKINVWSHYGRSAHKKMKMGFEKVQNYGQRHFLVGIPIFGRPLYLYPYFLASYNRLPPHPNLEVRGTRRGVENLYQRRQCKATA